MPDLWKYTRAQSDTDAETFFAACVTAGTTLSAGQKTAIYGLVGGLKQMSLWSKMTALYPFVGGTAGCHAINLKTPGTYNITWNGTVTHNSNGVTGNGSTGYGDTGIAPSSVLTLNSQHLSFYSRTQGAIATYDFACNTASSGNKLGLIARYSDNLVSYFLGTTEVSGPSTTTGAGFYVTSRVSSSSSFFLYRGGKLANTTTASVANPSVNLYILCRNNNGTPLNFSTRNYSLASAGSGLTDQDAQNLSLIVQSYQSALGRAV